jgi:hypothetical protein
VCNATFNNVSYSVGHGDQFYWCLTPLSTLFQIYRTWRSVLLLEGTGLSGEIESILWLYFSGTVFMFLVSCCNVRYVFPIQIIFDLSLPQLFVRWFISYIYLLRYCGVQHVLTMRVTWRVSYWRQELLTIRELMRSTSGISWGPCCSRSNWWSWFMVFNATFNTISDISYMAVSFIVGGNWIIRRKLPIGGKSRRNITKNRIYPLVVFLRDCLYVLSFVL